MPAAAEIIRLAKPLPFAGSAVRMYPFDFAGDSTNDLLLIASDSLWVLENRAGGPYGAPIVTPKPEQMTDAAVGDIDGDGNLDVVGSLSPSDTLVVYLGDGDGTFIHGPTIATLDLPYSVAIADFNGDGHQDVSVAQMPSDPHSSIAVHFGDASGNLGAPIVSTHASPNSELTPGDFNGDGKSDLLVRASYGTSLYLSDGTGHFSDSNSIAAKGTLATGDFNADGKLDFAVGAGVTGDQFMEVRLGNGNGTFVDAGSFPTIHSSVWIKGVDVDGDLDLDLVSGGSSGNVSVLRGNGDGSFASPTLWMTDAFGDVAIDDIDRDGKVDLAGLGRLTDVYPALSWIPGLGDAEFDADRFYLTRPVLPALHLMDYVRSADVSGDGRPDVVLTNKDQASFQADVVVLLNLGNGELGPPIRTALPGNGRIDVGDLNGDHKADVVAMMYGGESSQARAYLSKGDGTFEFPVLSPIPIGGDRIRLADLDGDGVLDLMFSRTTSVVIYRGGGDGTFTPLSEAAGAIARFIGDLDGDGLNDLVGRDLDHLAISLNQGNGVFNTTVTQVAISNEGLGALADFDGDGALDIMEAHEFTGTTIRFGNGDGTFGDSVTFLVRLGFYRSFVTADFDGDGNLDIASDSVLHYGNGDGRFRGASRIRTKAIVVDTADFDGNGSPDLLMADGPLAGVGVVLTRIAVAPEVATTLTLVGDWPDPQHAQRVQFTATIADTPIAPTGVVTFALDGVPFAIVDLRDRKAEVVLAMGRGTHTITATYAGDGYHAGSNRSIEQVVRRASTILAARVVPMTYYCGEAVRVTEALYAYVDSTLPFPSHERVFRVGETVLSAARDPYESDDYFLAPLPAGNYHVTVEYLGDSNYEPSSTSFDLVISQALLPSISAGSGVFANATENYASLKAMIPGTTIVWSITNGTIVSGQGTLKIRYSAGASGSVTLSVVVTFSACTNTDSVTIPISQRADGASMLYLITPCRVLDTRPFSPVLRGSTRDFTIAGNCGVPPDALSVAANITVIQPNIAGWLAVHPRGSVWGGTSTLNYRGNRTRANNAILRLGTGGDITVRNSESDLHLVLDVYGYFK